jgi:phloretin hydrolase
MTIKELTSEEKAVSYSKYYYRKVADPDKELMELVRPDRSMDPAQAIYPEEINRLLDPGYMDVETGWCSLPNGVGYISVHNKMPGVTVDMLDWWFAWHSLADLHYKIWYPPGHYGISISEKDRKKVLDPDVPIKQKIYGRTDHVVEDVGTGAEDIFIYFCGPEELGFDMSRFHAPNVAAMYGGYGLDTPANAPAWAIRAPAIMCHFIREIPGGIEFRTRFWMGCTLIDGKPVHMLPYGIKVPVEAIQGLAQHNVEEYSNLREILPEIYKELGGRIP